VGGIGGAPNGIVKAKTPKSLHLVSPQHGISTRWGSSAGCGISPTVDWLPHLPALCLSVLALAGTAVALLRSAPARLLRDAREARDCSEAVEADLAQARVAWVKYQDEIDGMLAATEKNRRRIAAGVSRLDKSEAANGEPDMAGMSSDQIRAHYSSIARDRGWFA